MTGCQRHKKHIPVLANLKHIHHCPANLGVEEGKAKAKDDGEDNDENKDEQWPGEFMLVP